MNYRHVFHAGNFADVFKHILLIGLINNLQKKDSAFCYLDTHAGIGLYDLESIAAQKTKEYCEGIAKIITQQSLHPWVEDYIKLVKKYNPHKLRYYPGSPLIAEHFLRQQDRMVLCELHDYDINLLREQFAKNKHVSIHFMNGYQALKAFLPPKEKRGLILIDPAFESDNEFITMTESLSTAFERFPQGIYALWYPIKERKLTQTFGKKVARLGFKNILRVELSLKDKPSTTELNGCGMIICNPPWQYEQTLHTVLPWLWQVLSDDQQGNTVIEWLCKS